MRITFSIEYITSGPQSLHILFHNPNTALGIPSQLPLTSVDDRDWTGTLTLPRRNGWLAYHYEVMGPDGTSLRCEWNLQPRTLSLQGSVEHYSVRDAWKDIPVHSYLYSSFFTSVLFPRSRKHSPLPLCARRLLLRVAAPLLCNGCRLALVGDIPLMGGWNPQKALPMIPTALHEWCCAVDVSALPPGAQFKFVMIEEATGKLAAWETGPNRTLEKPALAQHETAVWQLQEAAFDVTLWRGAGVVIPLFSIRSERDCGVGDFGGLLKMVDWAAACGMHMVQLLPINDTTCDHTSMDSYPYNAISVCALHPKYVDISQLPPLHNEAAMRDFEQQRRELNALPQVDDVAVNRLKTGYLRRLYRQEGKEVLRRSDCQEFCDASREWLFLYACYCYLRDLYGTPCSDQWPAHNSCNERELQRLYHDDSEAAREINYYIFVQFILHTQLQQVACHARSLKVALKGDLPIGVNRCGVEAWSEPYYFHFNGSAGAPPDDFSQEGQNWGFPTYNWEMLRKNDYGWWKRRLSSMSAYFDAYRIDHILGFFRIWQIPLHAVDGLLGQFSPALPLSIQEIESYGLRFDPKRFTTPYITRALLIKLFGKGVEEVTRRYLIYEGGDSYSLLPFCDTQRKVQQLFASSHEEAWLQVRDNLYRLLSNVLFIPDNEDPGRYHPRILVSHNDALALLTPVEQQAYRQLYEDFYFSRHNQFWYNKAMERLPALTQATPMLACGEDLGMVPQCVEWVMSGLRILSLKIERMSGEGSFAFGNSARNPYLSVDTLSTHDMSTLRGWWEEDKNRSRIFYNEVLGHHGDPPASLTGDLAAQIIQLHLAGSSMLCLLPWQDWMAVDERLRWPNARQEQINHPQQPRFYWRYRMHITIEQLLCHKELSLRLHRMIEESGRK